MRGRPKGPAKYYTIYLNKNDRVIAYGSAKEIAEALNISRATVYSRISKAMSGTAKKYAVAKDEW